MSDAYSLIPTETGKHKLAEALAVQSKIRLSAIALGDGGGAAVKPDSEMTHLVGEVWRNGEGDIFRVSIVPDHPTWVMVETAVPITRSGYVIREAGVFDDDGELFAYGNLPEICKPDLDEGVGMEVLIEIVIALEEAEVVLIALESRCRVFDLCGFSLSPEADLMLTLGESGDSMAVETFQRLSLMPVHTAFAVTENLELTATLPL
jgi:phage-related tail fiber protein